MPTPSWSVKTLPPSPPSIHSTLFLPSSNQSIHSSSYRSLARIHGGIPSPRVSVSQLCFHVDSQVPRAPSVTLARHRSGSRGTMRAPTTSTLTSGPRPAVPTARFASPLRSSTAPTPVSPCLSLCVCAPVCVSVHGRGPGCACARVSDERVSERESDERW